MFIVIINFSCIKSIVKLVEIDESSQPIFEVNNNMLSDLIHENFIFNERKMLWEKILEVTNAKRNWIYELKKRIENGGIVIPDKEKISPKLYDLLPFNPDINPISHHLYDLIYFKPGETLI